MYEDQPSLAARIVAASTPPRKSVRTNQDTGVPLEFFDDEDQGPRAYKRFAKQRGHAKERGIGWELTFAEWWGIWRESGRWNERGCASGDAAVMARHGDQGPYAHGNVRIRTLTQNFAESREVRADIPRRQPKKPYRPPVIPGNGRGWTLIKGAKKPYMVKIAEKYVGSFATVEEAESAYRAAAERYLQSAWPMAKTGPAPRKPQAPKPPTERIGYVYLQDVAAGLTNDEIAKKHGKASRSSIRMALLSAGLPTCHAEYLQRQAGATL